MARVDVLSRSSLWADEAVAEDAATGGVCGFQGLSLSEVAVADKEERRLVKGRAGDKEEVVVAPAAVVVKGKVEGGCFRPDGVVGDNSGESSAGSKRVHALPAEEVEWILAQKPRPPIPRDDRETLLKYYPLEMIDRIIETERDADEAGAAIQKDFFAFQDWVRNEQNKYGVVMVDDEFLARREGTRQFVKEQFDELFNRWEDDVSEVGNYSDLYATDEEEGWEGVVVDDDLCTASSEREVDYVREDNKSEEEFGNESSNSEFGNYSDTYATDDDEEDDDEEEVALESTSN